MNLALARTKISHLQAPKSVPQQRRREGPRDVLPWLLQHEDGVVRDESSEDARVKEHNHAAVAPSALSGRPRRLLLLGRRLLPSAALNLHVRCVWCMIKVKEAEATRAEYDELLCLRREKINEAQ